MDMTQGLLWSYRLDGNGGARDDLPNSLGEGEVRWSHWDRKHPETKGWIREESGLDELIREAMLAEETRPRCLFLETGLFAILRGVNLNPGADPEDMVSVRLWIDARRIITLRGPKVMAIQSISDRLKEGKGPKNIGDFLSILTSALIDRMGPVIDNLNDEVDAIEESVVDSHSRELRTSLGHLRRVCIALRRYLAPQREVFLCLQAERVEWISEIQRGRIREAADRLTRYIEDLDSIRERAAVTQEELVGLMSEQMNTRMYLLSLVAGIFLPLGLLTGLLGINVGGVPGTEYPWAFAIVCAILLALAGVGAWLLHKWKFF